MRVKVSMPVLYNYTQLILYMFFEAPKLLEHIFKSILRKFKYLYTVALLNFKICIIHKLNIMYVLGNVVSKIFCCF